MAENPFNEAILSLEQDLRGIISRLGGAQNELEMKKQAVERLTAQRDSMEAALARLRDG